MRNFKKKNCIENIAPDPYEVALNLYNAMYQQLLNAICWTVQWLLFLYSQTIVHIINFHSLLCSPVNVLLAGKT